LALSRGLMEALGGTITPEETPGGGLTMVLGLPVAAPLAPDGTAPDGRAQDGTAPDGTAPDGESVDVRQGATE
ncbi:MAG: two-component system, OmpR family, sensor histidine kinase KdpD, partial [Actinomycetota bacterium]|nr:two-component system, OmpR family, sensor histidine kinase KdpD [Actinomycetota bacterium]